MAKKKKATRTRIAMFAVGMVIGLGLIIFDQFETIEGFISGTETPSLGFIDVPIDPATGGILGTIVLGAPDVIPFEQAGTMIGVPFVTRLYPNSPCTSNLTDGDKFPRLAPDFGRRLSGERNQLDPVWWGSRDTGVTDTRDCAFAYAQFDIVDIPNDFVATSIAMKLEILETRGIRNTNNPSQQCLITLQDFNIDTIADAGVIDKLYEGLVVASGTWCNSKSVRTFQFGQSAVDLVNDAISGGAFDQGVRSDKLLFGFVPKLFDNLGTGKNRLSTEYWKTQGSLFLTGSSPPIQCNVGFTQVDFRCEPIICIDGQQVNATTNECEQIICANDEELIGNICTPIICNVGESVVGGFCIPIQCGSSDHLVGSECIPLICDVGFEAKQNECVVKTCGIGLELNQDTCQPIVCPSNTILNGNDCIERSCPAGQISVNNECTSTLEFDVVNVFDQSLCPAETVQVIPVDDSFDCMIERSIILQCGSGTQQVGDSCLPIDLSCPEGSVPQQNVCVQVLPDLMISQAPELSTTTIVGILIFGGSFFGLVGTTVRKP